MATTVRPPAPARRPAGAPPPVHGPAAYRTWQIAAPLATHHRAASCEEAGCDAFLHGFQVELSPHTNDRHKAALEAVVAVYGKPGQGGPGGRYSHAWGDQGRLTLIFEPGSVCFRAKEHRIRIDRPPLYVVRDGDWRGNPYGTAPQVVESTEWIDRYQEAIDARNRG